MKIISILLIILMSGCSASRMQTVRRTTITQNENGITETVETAPSETETLNTVFRGVAKDGQDSFKKGCARTIAERLTANLKQLETTNEQYGALMVIENQLVEAEFNKRYPKITLYKGGKGNISSGYAYKSGKEAGHSVSLTASKKLTNG